MLTLRLAFRNILRQKIRTMTTLFAIACGGISVIFVQGYFEDTYYKMRESYIHAHTGHLQIFRRGFSTDGRKEPFKYLIENPQEVMGALATLPTVSFIAPRLQFGGTITLGNQSMSCVVQGLDTQKEKTVPMESAVKFNRNTPVELWGPTLEQGQGLPGGSMSAGLLGKGLAKSLKAKPGDALTLLTGTVGGSINAWDLTVDGIFSTSSQFYDDHTLRVSIELAQELLRTQSAQSLVLMLQDTNQTERTRAQINKIFQEKNWDLEVKSWLELNHFYTQTTAFFGQMFLVLKLVIALIIILSIYNTMNLSVLERTNEIGTIMALGSKQSDVIKIFMAEGLILGLLGGTIGVVVGSFSTWMIGRIGIPMPPPPGGTMSWTSEPVVLGSAVIMAYVMSTLTALISTYLPARSAARLTIAEALRTSH